MKRRLGAIAGLTALLGLSAAPAFGSGGPPAYPLYVHSRGGEPAELARLYAGRLGVVLARSPEALLYLDWRLLHGLKVGQEAGTALSAPCCEEPRSEPDGGISGWLDSRESVIGADQPFFYVPTDRPGPNYSATPNCFSDAFDTAAATLRDRAARYGRTSPAVRSWLLTQDAVFSACSHSVAALPAAMANPPAWLKADRAYQEAAFALYEGRNYEAAERFGGIARDRSSPWRPKALYLKARAIQREALARPDPHVFAKARAAWAELKAAPAGTYGEGEAGKMLRALAYRDQPDRLLAELDHALNLREPADDIAASLRDYLSLSERSDHAEAADWIRTMRTGNREPSLHHASERWGATRDSAWLVAALSLANPDDEEAERLAADAARVKAGDPAWKTARYHLVRLTIGKASPSLTRARLDAILASGDLTLSDLYLFSAARAQVATGLADFARHAVRRPYCAAYYGTCEEDWPSIAGVTGRRGGHYVGLGADARMIIDQMPLETRVALSRGALLPAELRLDVALTSFARAVQLQDNRAIDRLASDLASLLPQLRRDWRAIPALRPGPAKRFAEYFVMAKIPGLSTDLAFYTRPLGTVAQFQGHWRDWMIVPRGAGAGPAEAPDGGLYLSDGYYYSEPAPHDLACLDACGLGTVSLRLPAFVASAREKAMSERAHFVSLSTSWQDYMPGTATTAERALPRGAVSVWEETLAYVRAHPRDTRSPEALYWLIHVARWGGNHDHLGKRAFQLLHARYPNSSWAARSPYYYD